jgi:prepilin-type N-terminal cleavage/methylation domain-containing protein
MNKKGFTMVELIAVITILGIIAIIAIPAYTNVSKNIKEKSLENKKDVIKAEMLKFANEYLMDDIKPEGINCSSTNPCCKEYDLYEYIVANGIYSPEENNNGNYIDNPVTNKKLMGSVKIEYDTANYKLKATWNEVDYIGSGGNGLWTNGVSSCS